MEKQRPRVLAIDDTPANLYTLGMALEHEFDVQIATSGAQGLLLAQQFHPDLILLDIMMPEMDGFETCRRFKMSPSLKDVPIVFVSALSEIESESQGLALGAADYISKPVNVDIARMRIRNLIEREALRTSVTMHRDALEKQVLELNRSRQHLMESELRLRDREAHLSAIIQNEPECITTLDAAGRLLSINPAGMRMLQVENIEQVLGQPILTYIAEEHHEAFSALHGRVIDGHSAVMEYELVGLKGERRWMERHAVPMQDGGHTVHLAVTRDVTERKHNQQRLEIVLREQTAMLDNDLIGIVKVVNRTIVWANPAFEKMLGYGRDAMSGMPTRQHYADEHTYATLGAEAYPAIAAGGIFRKELLHIRKDGRQIWVEMSGGLLDRSTGESLWAFIDITERKQAEAELKQQLNFGIAINQIAQAIIDGEDRHSILQSTCNVVGEVLGLDRVLIYDLSIAQWTAAGQCEWLNPLHPDLESSIGTFSLDTFQGAAAEVRRTRQLLISQHDEVNPHLVADGSGVLLHRHMNIKSLLWYPFKFSDGAFHVLALNQVYSRRVWTATELKFLAAVCQQVSIALTKIQLLEAQEKSREKLELAANVFTHAREGITITRLDGTIMEVNNAFTRITGYSREEAVGKNPRMLNSGRQDEAFYEAMWRQLVDKGHWYGELWNRRKNGELYAEMLTITTVRDSYGKAENYVALFTDITAFKEHEDQLQHIAHYDALTNLPNRVLLADRLRQAMLQEQRRGKKLAVVYIDLDGFKAVNDLHGHATGDQLLINLSSCMKQALRDGDTLARIGGDEFVAILSDLDDVNASAPILTRLLGATAQAVMLDHVALKVSASVGVTFYPQAHEVAADQLLRQADQAMYQAKLAGKNRYVLFDALEDSGVRDFHEKIEHIRRGLIEHEFVLHYQPKINMSSGEVIGVEALIRWNHPIEGLMAPALFLPTIENHRLAVDLGEWVLETALTQIERWREQGIPIPVSVNVGARHLQQINFMERLKEILERHPSVTPASLELEILETSVIEDLERVSQVIEDCRELGVLFAMDDFGTGYSSLTYLRRLHVNLLKIDRSFVRGMLEDVDDLTILQGVIGLAKSFRRQAIAEGVESIEHGTLLLQLGCELAQGFGIAKPMPADELAVWLQTWKPDASWMAEAPISPLKIPLLFAGIEHRAWVSTMHMYLRGERMAPPPLDPHQCNFSRWFASEGLSSCKGTPAFLKIEDLHRQVHDLGREMEDLQAAGESAQALEKFARLEQLRDLLLQQLNVLARS